MKHLFYLIAPLLLLIFSCEKDDTENMVALAECYHLNDIVVLPEGLKLRVIEVNDHLCPCFVRCTWPGYLEVIVQVEGANRGPDTLGWPDRVATFGDYRVTLGEILERPQCGDVQDVEAFCFEIKVE